MFASDEAKYLNLEVRGSNETWSIDGKYIYFVVLQNEDFLSKWELFRVSVKDGKIESLGLKSSGIFDNLSAHPDGRHFIFSERDESNSEVWVMENFLPENESVQNNEPK